MTDHYDQREALYDAGKWPEPAPVRRINVPAGPKWTDGEPANLAAAAEDADRWLVFLQEGRTPQGREVKALADCRAALRKHLEPQ
jgi:hypothetical protein